MSRSTGNQKKSVEPSSTAKNDEEVTQDNAARVGFFCRVIDGPEKGRYGVMVQYDEESGDAVIYTRDEDHAHLTVKYDDCRLDVAGRR